MMDCTDVKNFKPGGVYLQADSETTELSAEAERCTYCGRRGADNCDVPPPDVCEKAIAWSALLGVSAPEKGENDV
jgi:hypothetical protein